MEPRFSRRHLRLSGYEYTTEGAYFVTICSKDRKCIFGDVDGPIVKLSSAGVVANEWLSENYGFVRLDEWILMPNHLHAIIWLENGCSKPLGSLIGAFKTVSTRRIKEQSALDQIWQRDFYEHIIRNEKSLFAFRQYIRDNPVNWALDENNPSSTPAS